MGRSWAFIAGKAFLPDGDDPFAAGLGGTEQAVIRLTSALAGLGETVTVVGGAARPRAFGGVRWVDDVPAAHVTVAINDAALLPPRAEFPIVWMHNEVELARELRRGRFGALMRQRPIGVFVGAEQARRASAMLPFRRREVIPLGLNDSALRGRPAEMPPARAALFTSQAYRGLREVIGMWQDKVLPFTPGATLEALVAPEDVAEFAALATSPGVVVGPRVANDAVIAKLRAARVWLAPGHVSETFCLAAAEAIALGVPVVTLGRGALKERVRNGVDGFICRDWEEMARRTRTVLTDDLLWMQLHKAGLRTQTGRSWFDVARIWMELVRLG